MNYHRLRNLPPELWTRIFSIYVDSIELQDWRKDPLSRHTQLQYTALPVDGPILRKPARILASVCSRWRRLIAADNQMKVICGDISQIAQYISEDAASESTSRASRSGPRLWAHVPKISSSCLTILSELAPRIEAISFSTGRYPGHNTTDVFQTLAQNQFERLSYVRLIVISTLPSALPNLRPNCPDLTTLILINVQIVEVDLDLSCFSVVVETLPHLERLELINFASGVWSNQEFPHYSNQDDGCPVKLNSLKTALLVERTGCIIFFLVNATLPKLETLEIRGKVWDGFPAPCAWFRQKWDFLKLSKFALSPLDLNTTRLLTSCRFPQLSQLLVDALSSPSQVHPDLESPWPEELSTLFAPNLEQLLMAAHPMAGGEWLLSHLTGSNCEGPLKSLLLNIATTSSWYDTALPVSYWLNVPRNALANVHTLNIRVESLAVPNIDGNSLDHICAAFKAVVELRIYLELCSSGQEFSRFQFITPDCPGDPEFRTAGQQVILPRLETLSLFLKLDPNFGPMNPTIQSKNCIELRSFLQKRNSRGYRLKRLVFNHPIVKRAWGSLQRLVDDIVIDPNPWGPVEAITAELED